MFEMRIVFFYFDTTMRFYQINVRGKPKGQSRMDNPETFGTLGTQDTGRRLKTKQKTKKRKKTVQCRILKR